MSGIELWKRRLRPSRVAGMARRAGRRVVDRVRRPHRRAALLPHRGERRGRALFSYILDPFLLPPGAELPHTHTNYWESRQIGRTLAGLGYDVDVIHWTNTEFVPREPPDVLLDVRCNLERLAPLMDPGCLKIQHMETAHHSFHNAAQRRRLAALAERRGFSLRPQKLIEENRAIEHADYGITVGNEFTASTYAHAGRPIFQVPISVPLMYDWLEEREFERCRRGYLWFGSGGLVHKGLDLVLEAFAGLPELELWVCGPIDRERDFERAYARELYATPNIHTLGWVDIAGREFERLRRRCLAVVYPSCSEGGGGSVITCLHAGLLPIVTREASVEVGEFGRLLDEASVEAVRDAVRETAERPAAELGQRARAAWEHARRRHTRDEFARRYREVLEQILEER